MMQWKKRSGLTDRETLMVLLPLFPGLIFLWVFGALLMQLLPAREFSIEAQARTTAYSQALHGMIAE